MGKFIPSTNHFYQSELITQTFTRGVTATYHNSMRAPNLYSVDTEHFNDTLNVRCVIKWHQTDTNADSNPLHHTARSILPLAAQRFDESCMTLNSLQGALNLHTTETLLTGNGGDQLVEQRCDRLSLHVQTGRCCCKRCLYRYKGPLNVHSKPT